MYYIYRKLNIMTEKDKMLIQSIERLAEQLSEIKIKHELLNIIKK